MKKLLMLVVSGLLLAAVCQAESPPFQLVSVTANAVQFKVVSATTLYSVALVADSHTCEGKRFQNTKGDIQFPNGSTAIPGSSLLFPKQLKLAPGSEITISDFKTPKDFKAKSVMFLTEKGAKPLHLDVP
ncbi:MAG: hypothetical protein FWG62_08360 [Proteobacteria bacterium]|nr:hypothetical protein [Pseudomonadota bacterium]